MVGGHYNNQFIQLHTQGLISRGKVREFQNPMATAIMGDLFRKLNFFRALEFFLKNNCAMCASFNKPW